MAIPLIPIIALVTSGAVGSILSPKRSGKDAAGTDMLQKKLSVQASIDRIITSPDWAAARSQVVLYDTDQAKDWVIENVNAYNKVKFFGSRNEYKWSFQNDILGRIQMFEASYQALVNIAKGNMNQCGAGGWIPFAGASIKQNCIDHYSQIIKNYAEKRSKREIIVPEF